MPKLKTDSVPIFTVSFEFSNHVEKFQGSSIEECLGLFASQKLVEKCIVRVEYDGRTSEMILYPFQMKRLKVNQLSRELLAKRLRTMLK